MNKLINHKKFTNTFLLFLLVCISIPCIAQKKQTDTPAWSGILNKSIDYTLQVNGKEVFVAEEECFGDKTFHTSQVDVKGQTTITVTSKEPIIDYTIRPYHLNIKAEKKGNSITFKVNKPQMLMITINGYKPLCLFQTNPESAVKPKTNKNVIYFEKGIHEAGVITPKSGQTIYLSEGALVKGRIYADGVKNVKICGRGILDARGFTSKPEKVCAVEFKNAANVTIEGIGIRSGAWWQVLFLLCDKIKVRDMNFMSFGVNNDGIDIDGVTNLSVNNCFIGCGDDGFGWHAVDAQKNGEVPTRNCTAENCVIYNAYAGNGLRVGASMETTIFENITFENITVLDHVNAGICSDHSDWALVKNLTFENFYIEKPGKPVDIRIEKTIYSNNTRYRDERGNIENLNFVNLHAAGGQISIKGSDENHLVKNISFKDCFIGENKILNTNEMKLNSFVKNVSF